MTRIDSFRGLAQAIKDSYRSLNDMTEQDHPKSEIDGAELLMDLDHTRGSLDTALFYSKQLELALHGIAARLGVEPAALLDGTAMDLIPDRRTSLS